jgi:hypothetical protein
MTTTKIKLGEDISDSDIFQLLSNNGSLTLEMPNGAGKSFKLLKDSTGFYVDGPEISVSKNRREIVKSLGYDQSGISPYLKSKEDSVVVIRTIEKIFLDEFGVSKIQNQASDFDPEGNPIYYPDLSLHIGRKVKLLVDAPRGGSLKAGDVGEIVDALTIKFKTNPSYTYMSALDKDNLNKKCELLPRDPEIKKDVTMLEIDPDNLEDLALQKFGLRVGDHLDQRIISRWAGGGKNYTTKSDAGKFVASPGSQFVGARKIAEFKMFGKDLGFLVSDTLGVYLRAEGFKEFMESNH